MTGPWTVGRAPSLAARGRVPSLRIPSPCPVTVTVAVTVTVLTTVEAVTMCLESC
jgi:hypothetical protein